MSNIDTGGPAFPVDNVIARDEIGHLVGTEISSGGMSLRDYFAAKAMQAVYPSDYDYKTTARMSYEVADAMLEARK